MEAPPTSHCSRGTSRNRTCAGTSCTSIGKSGGENASAIRSRRPDTGDGGPQMSSSTFGSHIGAKNRSPSRWSRCRCVRRRCTLSAPRRASSKPSSTMPVPASNTSVVPSSRETSMHEVLPPKPTVCGPGVGSEPRQPHTFTCTPARSLPPEDRDHPDTLVLVGEERERRHCDVTVYTVSARDPKLLVRGAPFVQGDPRRTPLGRQGVAVPRPRREGGRPLVHFHLAGIREPAAKYLLGRLVVEHQPTVVVRDRGRRRQIRGELAGEDQDQVFGAALTHASSVRRREPRRSEPLCGRRGRAALRVRAPVDLAERVADPGEGR